MPVDSSMSALSVAEFLLWAALAFLFWRKRLQSRFPALGAYLALHVFTTPLLLAALYVQATPWGSGLYPLYFYPYWAIYIASALVLFFVCLEVFRSVLSPFPGLLGFGIVVFRWTALVSILVTFSTISFVHRGALIIPDIAFRLMRSVSILELCVLGFLCLCMDALHLSPRNLSFGIAVGFGTMAANDFILSTLLSWTTTLNTPLQYIYESVVLVVIAIWLVYVALPEPAAQPIVLPINSTIYRWNDIASALGHTRTQVAVQQQADTFFLTDVERVVEKVLSKNLKNRESES